MSRSLNKVLLIGNVGVDPILKKTPGGIPVTSFRMATSQNWKDRNGNVREQTDWHTIVAWRGLAEIVEKIIHKGSRIFVEGRLQTRNVEDKIIVDDKVITRQKQVVEILADNILLLDGKSRITNGKQHKYEENNNDGYSLNDTDYQFDSDYYDENNDLKFDDDEFNFDFDTSEFNSDKQ